MIHSLIDNLTYNEEEAKKRLCKNYLKYLMSIILKKDELKLEISIIAGGRVGKNYSRFFQKIKY